MKLASRLAARTLVVWLDTTTAPATITSASTLVRANISTVKSSGGIQVGVVVIRVTKNTVMPK